MGNTNRFDSNNYAFNSGSKKGVYLIHGYSSSTYEIKDLAEFLFQNGYTTIAKNLPGHGTTVDDCNNTKYTNWIKFVETDVAKLASKCDEIHVIGISMGSVLALHLATLFPINSLISAATVFKFNNEFNVRILVPLLSWLITKKDKASQYKDGNKLQFTGYSEYPLKALNQMSKLTNYVRPKLKKVKCPTLIIHSKSDRTSKEDNFHIVNSEIGSNVKNTLIVDNASHNLFCKCIDQKYIFDSILSFLDNHNIV